MPSVEGTLVTHCSAAVFPCDIELDEGSEGVWLEMFSMEWVGSRPRTLSA